MFAEFIHKHFKKGFGRSNNPKDKAILQDDDPLQNTRKTNNAMYKLEAKKFSIPTRNPVMNPNGNVFNFVRTKLQEESLNGNIAFINYEEYTAHINKTLESVPNGYINKTIESMDNLLSMVVKKCGEHIKY